jgi:hypothetical protein
MKTRIVVHADLGARDTLFLRGEGLSELSWEKGVQLKNEKPDEWVFETDLPFSNAEFKILVNDKTYELGENHPLYPGASVLINPRFPN